MVSIRYTVHGALRTITGEIRSWGHASEEQAMRSAKAALRRQYPGSEITLQLQDGRVCPRCGSSYTGYPAISREDDETEICSACGTDEALAAFTSEEITPDEEARMEALSQHWQERKAIESEYVERPW